MRGFGNFLLTLLETSNYLGRMEDELKSMLAAVGTEFSRATGRKPSGVWASAAKDGRFMERLERGQTFTAKVFDNAMRWFSDNWPENGVWPSGVARPAPTPAIQSEAAE